MSVEEIVWIYSIWQIIPHNVVNTSRFPEGSLWKFRVSPLPARLSLIRIATIDA